MPRFRVTIRSEMLLEEVIEARDEQHALDKGREEMNMSGLLTMKDFEARAQKLKGEDEEDVSIE